MEKATVETPAPNIADLEQHRQLIRDIAGGSAAMRNKRYLCKYPAEEMADYEARCARTFLDNFVDLAINKATGKIFAKPIILDNIPADIDILLDDIDRQGRTLDSFMMDVANTSFQDGISYVMADMPRTAGVVTLADEKSLGVRPYAIHVKPCCVLEVLAEMIGGVETLTRVRIKECTQQPILGEWGYQNIEQIRVWIREPSGLVRWELWRENANTIEDERWVMVDAASTTFRNIYLVPFYTNRTGFMLGAPGFQNIAESTLEHFQLKSDYQAALEMCNFGVYYAVGVSEDFKMKVGPRQSLIAPSPDSKFGILETSGAAVTLSLDAIKAVESRIESAGVNLRIERAGTVSATASAIDSEDTDCSIKAIAQGFGDSCELLLSYFAEMMGNTAPDMEVNFNTSFGTPSGTPSGLDSLNKARALGDISRDAYLSELVRRGELSATFDPAIDADLLSQEAPTISAMK